MHRSLIAAVVTTAIAAACASGGGGASTASSSRSAACPRERWPASAADTVFLDTQVDRPARPRRGNPDVAWPSGPDPRLGPTYYSRIRELPSADVELRFVVDAKGCADMRTVQVVASTDTMFTLAVVDALPDWRFDPAVKARRPVAQLLHWKWALYRRAGARIPGTE